QVGVTGSEAVVRSRATDDGEWTTHARARLDAGGAAAVEPLRWPPAADPVDPATLYGQLAAAGYEYGPLFQGVRRLWQRPGEVFAEVELADAVPADGFGLHPALFDAALHPLVRLTGDDTAVRLPFSWRSVRVTPGPEPVRRLRVRLTTTGDDAVRVVATDERGRPVLSVDGLTLLATDEARLGVRDTAADVYELRWRPIEPAGTTPPASAVLTAALPGAPADPDIVAALRGLPGATGAYADLADLTAAPDLVLVTVAAEAAGSQARPVTAAAVRLVQRWLADPRRDGTRLVVVTRHAAPGDTVEDLAHAPLWGLLRSAEREHPGRFGLLDVDAGLDPAALGAALATLGTEPQLLVRGGEVRAPRLGRTPEPSARPALGAAGTVLITGGTGTLGALVARHLVDQHGVRQLLLLSRRGAAAEGAEELVASLTAQGAEVTVAACDIADADALRDRVAALPADRPLAAVIHAAGVLDDATLTNVTDEQLDAVLRPKIDAALALAALEPPRLILFSGAAATLGPAGQGHYAAGNAFLEALAARRAADGRPTTALGWGFWARRTGMTGHLDDTDRRRIARLGLAEMTTEEGLALFDAALATDRPVVLPLRLDRPELLRQGRDGTLPALFHDLVPVPAAAPAQAAPEADLATAVAELPADDGAELVLDTVRAQAAGVLGHQSADAVPARQAFKDFGFDSLAAVELRNRLNRATGLRLPATSVFDHPTPAALADHIFGLLSPTGDRMAERLEAELRDIEVALGTLDAGPAAREGLLLQVRRLAERLGETPPEPAGPSAADRFETASDEELFAFLNNGAEGRGDAAPLS
ncbi:type I polyketide synthase, partial [Micromonospora sp. DT233]|uniref:type I polyketide synthase n=1 Tax=Micromonospora sp. DT233 TaxID=3393432 RepID=UPI003CEB5D68